jgi:lysine-N-methylase
MTMTDGACLQLGTDSRCGLELRGGPLAKPVGCRSYPATLVDDGESIRVSVAPECDCVFESRAGGALERLVGGASAADIEAGLGVRRLADRVEIAPERFVTRSEYAAWSRRVAAGVEPADVPERTVSLAAALARGELADWPPEGSAEADAILDESVRTFAATMQRAAASAESWRSQRDRTRVLRRAVADAAAAATRGRSAAVALPDDEALVVRAAIFGHQVAGGADVAGALAALAARLVVARLMAGRSPELGHPIAAVLAASRGAIG